MPSIRIACPPATFLTSSQALTGSTTIDRAARRVGLHGTLDGSFVVLVPTGTYIWYATSGTHGISGVDPATHTSNLGTGYRVLLSGSHTPTEVAEHTRYASSLISGFTATRSNSTATIQHSSIVVSSVHAGTRWANRGFADIKGARQPYTDSSGPVNRIISQAMPWSASNGRIRFMRIGRAATGGTYRAAIYFSPTGTSITNPSGSATLLYDFGLTPGNIINGYEYVFPTGTYVSVPSTGTVWLTVKDNNTHGDIRVLTAGNQSTENSDFFNQNFFETSNTGYDPTVAYPYRWADDGTTFTAVRLDMAMGVDFPPFAGAGDLEFQFGTHLSATAGSTSNAIITGTLMMRSNLPTINGIRIVSSTMAIGSTHVEQYRGGIYIDGTIANPSGAIGHDLGQTTGSATNQYHSVASSVHVNTGSVFGVIWKQNGGGSSLLFTFNADPDPLYNPSDWNEQAEYETFSTGLMNRDETVAYEASYITSSTDTRPGNYPRFYVNMVVDGFQFSAGPADPSTASARSYFIIG